MICKIIKMTLNSSNVVFKFCITANIYHSLLTLNLAQPDMRRGCEQPRAPNKIFTQLSGWMAKTHEIDLQVTIFWKPSVPKWVFAQPWGQIALWSTLTPTSNEESLSLAYLYHSVFDFCGVRQPSQMSATWGSTEAAHSTGNIRTLTYRHIHNLWSQITR